MKITVEHEGHRSVVEDEHIVDITDAIDLMELAFVEIGYDAARFEGAILYKAQEIRKK